MVSIINYGMGNLGSVLNMFKRIGAKAQIVHSVDEIRQADKLLLPGVGAFGNAIKLIDDLGFRAAIVDKVKEEDTPILGICLGMQLLMNDSEESPGSKGLGLIDANVIKFRFEDNTLKVPHIGWNEIEVNKEHPLIDGLPESSRFYFVHSYYVKCSRLEDTLASTKYGIRFVSMVQLNNIMGAQFHPEKSHKFGMRLLHNFANL